MISKMEKIKYYYLIVLIHAIDILINPRMNDKNCLQALYRFENLEVSNCFLVMKFYFSQLFDAYGAKYGSSNV